MLDYHLTEMPCSRLEVEETTVKTDHKMVSCTVIMANYSVSIKEIMQKRIKAHLGADAAVEIMLNKDWPEKPYIDIASQMDKCRWTKLFPD